MGFSMLRIFWKGEADAGSQPEAPGGAYVRAGGESAGGMGSLDGLRRKS